MMSAISSIKRKIFSNFDKNSSLLVRGAAGSFAIKIAGAGVAFAAQIVFARLLGAESYGMYIYAITWMTSLAVLGTFGLDWASVRFVAAYHGRQEWGFLRGFLKNTNQVVFFTSVTATLLLVLGVWILRERLATELLYTFWIAAAALPLTSVLQVREGGLRGFKKVVQAEMPRLVLIPLFIVAGFPAALFWFDLKANAMTAMGVHLVATLLALITISLLLHRAFPGKARSAKLASVSKEWLRMAGGMMLIAGSTMIFLQTDIIMLGAILGTKQAGIYAIGSRVAFLLMFVIAAVNSILAPLASDIHANGTHSDLQRITTIAALVIFSVSLPAAILLFLWGREILGLFGKEFTIVYPVLAILIIGKFVNVLAGPAGMLLNMTGHQNTAAKVMGFGAAFNIILNAMLIPLYGLTGAAVATAITTVLWSFLMTFIVWRRLGILSMAYPLRVK